VAPRITSHPPRELRAHPPKEASAIAHFLTNRGKLLLVQGQWDDAAATTLKLGLLKTSIPAAVDTAAEVADLNTVNDLLVTSAATEAAFAGYARKNLSRTNAAEDDTNDRVNMAIAAVTWTAAPAGETIVGAFWYDATTDTNDTTRLLMGLLSWTGVPTNGSDFTLSAGDLVRAS
jgi:hypothetical protein